MLKSRWKQYPKNPNNENLGYLVESSYCLAITFQTHLLVAPNLETKEDIAATGV